MTQEYFAYSTHEKVPLTIESIDNEVDGFVSELNNTAKRMRLNYLTAEFIERQLGNFLNRIKNNYKFNQTQNQNLINFLAEEVATAVIKSFEFYARKRGRQNTREAP
jgi:hypothetical protein